MKGNYKAKTKTIMQIDHDLGVIEFDDGTRWVVSPGDRSVIVGWMPITEEDGKVVAAREGERGG
jgi:uncharacterized protein YkvS